MTTKTIVHRFSLPAMVGILATVVNDTLVGGFIIVLSIWVVFQLTRSGDVTYPWVNIFIIWLTKVLAIFLVLAIAGILFAESIN